MAETVFVGRERELKRLNAFLDQVLMGQGQVAFVTGEAGSGKTALISAFIDRALQAHADLLVAMGNCNAQSGIGDPYLPFREVLAALTGLADERTAQPASRHGDDWLKGLLVRSTQVLVEFGPDLVGTIVPGSSLIAKFGKAVAQKAGLLDELDKLVRRKAAADGSGPAAIEQSRIFEQYANVLVALAQQAPLVLVLDDLHWVDDASASLLFHLSRRIERSRILIVGTYRPDEVAAPRGDERHPLAKALAEIKRYAGDVWIDLDQTSVTAGRAFVDQVVDSEPNQLDDAFRQALFARTNGHALFTVELLRALQERGDVVRDAQGRWVASPTLNWQAGTIPARVEGALTERLGRLAEAQRELLRVASVEGVDFTAEVVAQVQQVPVRQMYKDLSQSLERRHRLVRERGMIKAGRQSLAGYQFTHALYQQALYDELGGAERRLLHGDVARAVEQCFAEQLDDLCARLAWHYEQAGDDDRAAEYLIRAGERAVLQGAPLEARGFLDRALVLLPAADRERRYRAVLGREAVWGKLGEPEARRRDIATLVELAQALDDDAKRAAAYERLAKHAQDSGDFPAEVRAADLAIAAARRAHQPVLELLSLEARTYALHRMGQTEAARQSAEEVLACLNASRDSTVTAFVSQEIGGYYADTGDPMRAIQLTTQAVSQAREQGDRYAEGITLFGLGYCYGSISQFDLAKSALERAAQLLTSVGDRFEAKSATSALNVTCVWAGEGAAARPALEQIVAQLTDVWVRGLDLVTLAYAAAQMNEWDVAVQRAREGYDALASTGALKESIWAKALLARYALRSGRLAEAQSYATDAWAYLQTHSLIGWGFGVAHSYLACAEVFQATGDINSANAAIAEGYREMMAIAEKLTNAEWRKVYLETLPDHVALAARWHAIHPEAATR